MPDLISAKYETKLKTKDVSMATAKPYPSQEYLSERYRYEGGKIFSTSTGKEVKGYETDRGYLKIRISGKSLFKHRVIWKLVMGREPDTIDHINGDKMDNRIENLRDVPQRFNVRNNLARGGQSKFKGVYLDKRSGKYGSRIKLNKKTIHLGTYLCEIDAALAYDRAALEMHGEYAKTNEMLGLL